MKAAYFIAAITDRSRSRSATCSSGQRMKLGNKLADRSKWSRDGLRPRELMLYAGNNLDNAREVFTSAVKHRPRIRLTIRQRTRVLQQWAG
jgi:hypothetical protein